MTTQGITAQQMRDADALCDYVAGIAAENGGELLDRADVLLRKLGSAVRPTHRAEVYSVIIYLLLVLRDDMPVHPLAYMEATNLHITP